MSDMINSNKYFSLDMEGAMVEEDNVDDNIHKSPFIKLKRPEYLPADSPLMVLHAIAENLPRDTKLTSIKLEYMDKHGNHSLVVTADGEPICLIDEEDKLHD